MSESALILTQFAPTHVGGYREGEWRDADAIRVRFTHVMTEERRLAAGLDPATTEGDRSRRAIAATPVGARVCDSQQPPGLEPFPENLARSQGWLAAAHRAAVRREGSRFKLENAVALTMLSGEP